MTTIHRVSRFAKLLSTYAQHSEKAKILPYSFVEFANRYQCFGTSSVHKSQAQANQEPILLTAEENGIRTICLNDPKKRNALSLNMLQTLHKELKRDQDTLRVVIIKATGHVFSAGHDLKELAPETGSKFHAEVFNTCTSVMNLIQDMDAPVIAQINGLATAAGCQLVATCDIAVASSKSQFATPGVNVGLFCSTPGVALGRAVPRKVAMEMLLTGHPISAQDALLHGLVSKVVPEEEVENETMRIAKRICETSRKVTGLGKATFYAQMGIDKKNAYRLAERMMVENLTMADGKEGISAFIQKRKPVWDQDSDSD